MDNELILLSYLKLLPIADEFAEEFQLDDKELVANQGPLEALYLEQGPLVTMGYKSHADKKD